MVSFSQLPAVKKDTIFGAARKFFGPSYFVMALEIQMRLQNIFGSIFMREARKNLKVNMFTSLLSC